MAAEDNEPFDFGQIHRAHEAGVYRLILSRLSDRAGRVNAPDRAQKRNEDAADLTVEAWLTIYRRRSEFRSEAEFVNALYETAKTLCDSMRR